MLFQIVTSFSQAKPFTRCLLSAIAGFFFYGGWAYFVNFDYGLGIASKAFVTQGIISFCITLVLTQFMEYFFNLFSSVSLAFWTTSIITSSLVVLTSSIINVIVGTPEVLITILPGAILSAIYTFSYSRFLYKNRSLTA